MGKGECMGHAGTKTALGQRSCRRLFPHTHAAIVIHKALSSLLKDLPIPPGFWCTPGQLVFHLVSFPFLFQIDFLHGICLFPILS